MANFKKEVKAHLGILYLLLTVGKGLPILLKMIMIGYYDVASEKYSNAWVYSFFLCIE